MHNIFTGSTTTIDDGDDGKRTPERRNEGGARYRSDERTGGTGEWLVQKILDYGCASVNEFEERSLDEPKFRQVVFRQNYENLVRKALEIAKGKVRNMSFMELSKMAYYNREKHVKYHQCLSAEESYHWFLSILAYNGFDKIEFIHDVFKFMDKMETKKNTLMFLGPPNAGKTLVAESIAIGAIYYANIQRFAKGQQFPFAEAVGTRCCMLNEPRITDDLVETLKNIAEGCPCHVEVKYKSGQILQRTPLLVATNHPLSMYVQNGKELAERAFNARCITYRFKNMDELRNCKGKLNPALWLYAAREMCRYDMDIHDKPCDSGVFEILENDGDIEIHYD